MTTHTLTGDWYNDDGTNAVLAPRRCDIEIADDGAILDIDEYGYPSGVRLRIDGNGHLVGWAAATFAPDAGELERVDLA